MAKSKKKNKLEFSKCLTLIAIIILMVVAIWSIVRYYELTKLAIECDANVVPDSAIPIACVTTILGTLLSYCLYQGLLKASLNKNKLTIDDNGLVKPIFNEIINDICTTPSNNCCATDEIYDFPEQDKIDCDYK